MLPSIFGDSLFDEWFDLPFRELQNADRKLYGRHAAHEMKTDVHEHEDHYEEDISAKFENGVLSLNIARHDQKKLPEKKYIQIEG